MDCTDIQIRKPDLWQRLNFLVKCYIFDCTVFRKRYRYVYDFWNCSASILRSVGLKFPTCSRYWKIVFKNCKHFPLNLGWNNLIQTWTEGSLLEPERITVSKMKAFSSTIFLIFCCSRPCSVLNIEKWL